MIPLFEDLEPFLQESWDVADEGAEFVIPSHRRQDSNIGTLLRKHIKRSGVTRGRRIVGWCKFRYVSDVNASGVEAYLADLRSNGRSRQTSNHYLAAMKEFCRWLVLDRRTGDDPIQHLKRLNVSTDRRHDRQALDSDEFARLLEAAETGASVQGVSGTDRTMLYVMAAWTGFRRGELASLTTRSLDLDSETPTVRVEAAYSKLRRTDEVPLHPEVVERLRAWLASCPEITSDEPLFPLKTPKGHFRATAKMMRADLERAREKWLQESSTPEERQRREESSFLTYRNDDGLFADFHANRHIFISNLGRAGVTPKEAQTLARHSDINLTMGIYSHVGVNDQAAAVRRLPGPPPSGRTPTPDEVRATGTAPRHVHQHVQMPVSGRPRLSASGTDGGRGDRSAGSKKKRRSGVV